MFWNATHSRPAAWLLSNVVAGPVNDSAADRAYRVQVNAAGFHAAFVAFVQPVTFTQQLALRLTQRDLRSTYDRCEGNDLRSPMRRAKPDQRLVGFSKCIGRATGVAALLHLACFAANADVNRCVDSSGRVEYRTTPCEGDTQSRTVPIGHRVMGNSQPPVRKDVRSKSTRSTYALEGEALSATDNDSGKTASIPLPTSFPSFSWPTGVAHDTDLDIVTVVTMGGEGYLYRYDARRKQWLDYRSMNNIDVVSLSYDAPRKLYVARAHDGAVLLISNQGEILGSRRQGSSPSVKHDSTTPGTGLAIKPVNDRQLAVLRQPPPRELAAGAELVVVSGYTPSSSVTRVVVDRPGKRVLLILSSYEKILWRVEASRGTAISGIVLASFHGESGVIANESLLVHRAQLPYADEADNVNFRRLLQQLNALFGVARIDAFKGQHQLPTSVEVAALTPDRADLTLRGFASTPPSSVFAFDLLTRDLRKATFRNDGTSNAQPQGQALLDGSKIALDKSGRRAYVLTDAGLKLKELESGLESLLALPASFPAFSWATGVAYDEALDIVTVVTLGGEGFLYRYDAKRKQWLEFRSLNNIDITSLAYDPQAKRYVAWTSEGALLFISSNGEALDRKPLSQHLTGFGSLYDRGNERPPSLTLAPRGSQIALVYVSNQEVQMIWTYSEKNGQAQLTYKRDGPAEKPVR